MSQHLLRPAALLAVLIAWLLPAILVAYSFYLFWVPDDADRIGRVVTGWVMVIIAAAGLWHLVAGLPGPSDGLESLAAGGGMVGWVATVPLSSLIGPALAVTFCGSAPAPSPHLCLNPGRVNHL